ncbi:MAG: outer membrane protein assembly factor BamE, partial [Alphaproteobacteria bacterium]
PEMPPLHHTLACALVAAAVLGACTPQARTRGHVTDEAAVAELEVGSSTQDDVAIALGSPSSTNAFGPATWYYITAHTERTAFFEDELIDQQVVAIGFDDAGIVSAIDRYGTDDRWDLALVGRETPTYGRELGILQQLIGNIGRFTKAGGELPR